MADDIEFVRNKNVVAVIAFRDSSIYPTDASPGERPEGIVATDPLGRYHKVQHGAGNPPGPTRTTARSTGTASQKP